MTILNQKTVRLVNDETSTRNLDSSMGIYLTAAKVAQCSLCASDCLYNFSNYSLCYFDNTHDIPQVLQRKKFQWREYHIQEVS